MPPSRTTRYFAPFSTSTVASTAVEQLGFSRQRVVECQSLYLAQALNFQSVRATLPLRVSLRRWGRSRAARRDRWASDGRQCASRAGSTLRLLSGTGCASALALLTMMRTRSTWADCARSRRTPRGSAANFPGQSLRLCGQASQVARAAPTRRACGTRRDCAAEVR